MGLFPDLFFTLADNIVELFYPDSILLVIVMQLDIWTAK